MITSKLSKILIKRLNSMMDKFCRTCLRVPQVLLPLYDDQELCLKIKAISNVEVTMFSLLWSFLREAAVLDDSV